VTWDDVAGQQGGMVTRRQLRALRRTDARIDGMVQRGLLICTRFHGVYRVAGAPVTPQTRIWTFVLATGAVASYLTAAAQWGYPVPDDGLIHVTRHERARYFTVPGLRIHRTELAPPVITTRNGLPITTRTETLLDCLGWLALGPARTLLDRALQENWLSHTAIPSRLEQQPGRWGNRQLKRLHDDLIVGAEAESERRVLRILRSAGINGWVANFRIRLDGKSFRLDIAFPQWKIAIEVEGWTWHRTRDRRDRDVTKLNALTRNGWALVVLTYAHTDDPEYVLAQIMTLLAERSVQS
jgi:hypothetical protein